MLNSMPKLCSPGCFSRINHPCEKCGRVDGRMFAIHSGWIKSRVDGDVHRIGCGRLMELWGVKQSACVEWGQLYNSDPSEWDKFIHLHPDGTGRYDLRDALFFAPGRVVDPYERILELEAEVRKLKGNYDYRGFGDPGVRLLDI